MKKQTQAYSMTDSSNNTSKASPPTGGESISKNIKNNQPNQVAHNTGSSNREFLAKEPIGKLLAKLALPTVAAQMINMLYNIVDRIYIGHIPQNGSLALTGVGVCMPLIMIISAFAALVGNGGAPRATIYMGKNKKDDAEKILGNCFTMQIILSVILTAVLLIWNRDLLLAFGASKNTINYATSYMNIYAIGTIFVQLTLGMNAFITAQGFAKEGMLSVLIGAIANIILDPIFIFALHMGKRRGPCNNHFSGLFLHLGLKLPLRQADNSPHPCEKPRFAGLLYPAMSGTRFCRLYHAGK